MELFGRARLCRACYEPDAIKSDSGAIDSDCAPMDRENGGLPKMSLAKNVVNRPQDARS